MSNRLPADEVRRRQRTKSGILTEPEVARIKWRLDLGASPRDLARDYQVSLWTIRAIGRGDTWAWVESDQGRDTPITPAMNEEQLRASQARLNRLLEEANERKAQERQAADSLEDLSHYGITKDQS